MSRTVEAKEKEVVTYDVKNDSFLFSDGIKYKYLTVREVMQMRLDEERRFLVRELTFGMLYDHPDMLEDVCKIWGAYSGLREFFKMLVVSIPYDYESTKEAFKLDDFLKFTAIDRGIMEAFHALHIGVPAEDIVRGM